MDCVTDDAYGHTLKSALRAAYSEYCKKHKLKISGERDVKNILAERFGVYDTQKQIDGERERIWEGIVLKG